MEIVTSIAFSREEMERRRIQAAQDLLGGHSQSQVARKFGVSRTTASRWQRALSSRGIEALRKRKATGRPSRLTAEQLAGVRDIFHRLRPADFSLAGDRWTTARMAEAIFVRYQIRYDPDHVGRIMHRLDLLPRRAARRARALPYVMPSEVRLQEAPPNAA
ncbi:MAG: transposase [Acidobacteria bacterium]|nr:transposase [Acidobacteriota bacterium]